MDPNEVQRKAAETMLERGVRVPLPAPRFFRLFGKKTVSVTVTQPYLRTLFTASALALKDGFSIDELLEGEPDAALKLINQHAKTAARSVAIYLLNGKWKNRLFSRLVGNYLFSKLNNQKLLEMSVAIVLLTRYQDFTSSIRLIRQMSLTMMMPKNLGQKENGSQGAEQ